MKLVLGCIPHTASPLVLIKERASLPYKPETFLKPSQISITWNVSCDPCLIPLIEVSNDTNIFLITRKYVLLLCWHIQCFCFLHNLLKVLFYAKKNYLDSIDTSLKRFNWNFLKTFLINPFKTFYRNLYKMFHVIPVLYLY